MGDWRKMGHGMRRRQGSPSSHLDGSTGGVLMDDMQGALGSMVQGGRAPIGPDVASAVIGSLSSNPSHNPDMVRAKYAMQLTDPALSGTGARTPITNNSTERMGASFGVKANYAPTIDPSAGQTQANGKIVPSSFPRTEAAFGAGVQA